ncbi:MAG TPA: hypothetical protein VNJ01_17935 [Bacteriovoracaceae bacterium]|nr:hypothetical protein [Bacteriovoracaceae bacterium]
MHLRSGLSIIIILLVFGMIPSCTNRKTQTLSEAVAPNTRSVASGNAANFLRHLPSDRERKHVHLMHLDGFRADVFQRLLQRGRLPHFEFLLNRGKISYDASTVDKSETFKVVESYLTSRRDTYVTGWWQFNRSQFRFKNYWIDPPEVVNYELGLMFPSAPTIYDVIAEKSGPSAAAAGFTLHRRNVAASHYTRNFAAGYKSISEHVYFDQANETMTTFLNMLKKFGKDTNSALPKLTSSMLAPADEWGHLRGIVEIDQASGDRTCFRRNDPRTEIIFKLLDDPKYEGIIMPEAHFVEVKRKWAGRGGVAEFCVDRFTIDVANEPMPPGAATTVGQAKRKWINTWYVLGMIQVDIELGRLIDETRRIQFLCLEGGDHCYNPQNPRGIARYIRNGVAENSLFENTLFLFTGDHGMVDTKHMMTANTPYNRSNGRSNDSKSNSLIEYLNAGLGLKTPSEQTTTGPFGITDSKLPKSIEYPYEDASWQTPAIKAKVKEANEWAEATFVDVQASIKDKQYQKYWWLSVLRKSIIDPKITSSMDTIRPHVLRMLTGLYLQGDLCSANPKCYVNEEAKFLKRYYDQNVRFVYGGAALNNGEFFLPGAKGWTARPTGQEIFELKPGGAKKKTVIQTLQDMESIGLIFIRANNEKFHPSRLPPASSDIIVMDAMNNSGLIHVKRDPATGILVFAYEGSSETDPLGYDDLAQRPDSKLVYRTYDEWNQLSVERKHYYHNVVAGMGTYLFSNNPHIGDVSVMHREGWNFGDNGGGHGGVHREEKLTVMIASGPGMKPGMLKSLTPYKVNQNTQAVERSHDFAYPTVVDLAPTALKWLGYGNNALMDLQLDGFTANLQRWKKTQSREFTDDFIAGFENEVRGTSQENMINLRDLKPRLKRLFQFIDNQKFETPKGYLNHGPDGNQLHLGD